MLYEIWSEGWIVTGEQGKAMLWGSVEADSFHQAVLQYAQIDEKFKQCFDEERMTYWGCRLFDKEKDARKFNG